MAAGICLKWRLNLDPTGLLRNIYEAALRIDSGRKGFAIIGKEREGRINYESGIALAMETFKEAQAAADPETILLAEYTFITQELQFCEKTDKESLSSLTQALQFFDEAFPVLKIVKDKTLYQEGNLRPTGSVEEQAVDKSLSHKREFRFKGFPKDAFHVAFGSHKARLQNILKTPGLDPIEKTLLKQRLANISAGQKKYVEMQGKALGNHERGR